MLAFGGEAAEGAEHRAVVTADVYAVGSGADESLQHRRDPLVLEEDLAQLRVPSPLPVFENAAQPHERPLERRPDELVLELAEHGLGCSTRALPVRSTRTSS